MIELRVLGGAGLRDDQGHELREVLVKPKSFALLVYLTLAAPGGFIRRDTLFALFWPESDTAHARNALRQTIHHLRNALGEGVLISRGAEELGVNAERLMCDAVTFAAAVQEGAITEARAVYGGELLPGFFAPGSPDFDDWLDQRRSALRETATKHGCIGVIASPSFPPPARPQEVLPPARASRPTIPKRWAALAVIVVAVVALTVVEWANRRPAPAVASDVGTQSVAVLPFMIRGHDSLAYLRTGMVNLLSTRLDGASRLRSVDPRAVVAVSQSGDSLEPARIATRLGADLYVVGDAVETAGRLQLDAILVDGQGATVGKATVEGPTANIFQLADGLAAQLLAAHAGSAEAGLVELARGSTVSLPAFKSYLAGDAAFEAGRYEEAMAAFQRAVAQDTAFGLAYYRLAVAADWAGAGEVSRWAAARAVQHPERLSRLAGQLLAGFQRYSAPYAEAAEGIYLDLAGAYPDNLEATYMLGEVRFHYNAPRGRQTGESRESFERVLAVAPHDGPALVHLARVAALEGQVAELDSLAARFLALYPGGDRALEMRALRAFAGIDRAEQDRIMASARGQSDVVLDVVARGVGTFDEDLVGAARIATVYIAPGRSPLLVARGYELLVQLDAGRGRWSEARRELDAFQSIDAELAIEPRAALAVLPFASWPRAELRALRTGLATWHPVGRAIQPGWTQFVPQLRAYFAGLMAIRLGDTVAVHGDLRDLDRLSETAGDSNVAADLARVVRADLALRYGRAADALREIVQFRFTPDTRTARALFFVSPEARFLRGEILEALGRDSEALAWYASFPDPNGVDLAFLAQAHLHQAHLDDRLGRRADAVPHYERFIAMWQDSDTESRGVVRDARAARDVATKHRGS